MSDLYHGKNISKPLQSRTEQKYVPRRKLTSRKTLGFDKSGRYFRNLGYVRSRSGKYSQKKFYFGYDEDLAKVAVAD